MKKLKFYSIALSLFIASTVSAELDKYDSEALGNTQNFLNDKNAREAFIKQTPDAQKHVNQMNSMGMSADQKNQTYGISSDVFTQLIQEQKGDASAVNKMLLNAQQNPEAFYNSLSPDIRAKIQGLGLQIESKKSATPK